MRITELTLQSGNLSAQKEFYSSILGLEIINDSSNSFSVEIGDTVLAFQANEGKPYYHFAINIPSNQILDAYQWIKERISILPFEGEDLVNFSDWNATALYFYDEDQNIVELIARKNLNINSNRPFSAKSFLHISEVGYPTNDVKSVVESLKSQYGLSSYDGDLLRFNAVGSESGLFIVVNKAVKDWIPNDDAIVSYPFKITIQNNCSDIFRLTYKNQKIHLDSTPQS